jgi:hypothetical protein
VGPFDGANEVLPQERTLAVFCVESTMNPRWPTFSGAWKSPRATQNTVLYDPFSYASTGQVQVITTSRVAFNVLATEAIEIIEGVRTS